MEYKQETLKTKMELEPYVSSGFVASNDVNK